MGFWDRIKSIFTDDELKKLDEVAGVPSPPALPYRGASEPKESKVIDAEFEEGPYLMYNIQGGEGLDKKLMAEFMAKSRRRAVRHFKGKEVKHRVRHKSRTKIEFEFNRKDDPNHVEGPSVCIRWTNKSAEVDA